ncbi:unnamed protein product [Effrenium voratum]|nr:unnamed protein product [Effrenium voratum]
MTTAEPLLEMALQEIENSTLLPGYRLNVLLADSKCTREDATAAAVEAFYSGDPKHAILGDACSDGCEAVSDVSRFFKVLQVSPGCGSTSLSERSRYPYLARLAPSDRFKLQAIFEVMKMFSFKRVSLMYQSNENLALFQDLVQRDVEAGYAWITLLTERIVSISDAERATAAIQTRDSRITVLSLNEEAGAMLLCQAYLKGMVSPDFVWLLSSGNWGQNFPERANHPHINCTAPQLLAAARGLIAAELGPMLQSSSVHGLSGRPLADIHSQYAAQCQSFGNGTGRCNFIWTPYFYDGLWQLANVFHSHLSASSQLTGDAAQEALYNISLQQDYLGLSGQVRYFDSEAMHKVGAGDRDGTILLRQVVGPLGDEFQELAYWTGQGITWKADIVWGDQRVACSGGSCNLTGAVVPLDRGTCAAGRIFVDALGCQACPTGRFEEAGQCVNCPAGSFAASPGLASCEPCPAGSAVNFAGAEVCEVCTEGHYQNETGALSCLRCPVSFYGPSRSLPSCLPCPEGKTTAYEASHAVPEGEAFISS